MIEKRDQHTYKGTQRHTQTHTKALDVDSVYQKGKMQTGIEMSERLQGIGRQTEQDSR